MDNEKVGRFKDFVKGNSFLIDYIRHGKKSWQDLYEMYDLYGEDEVAWAKFLEDEKQDEVTNNTRHGGYLDEMVNTFKNIDVDKVQEGITSLQKTLGLFGELFVNKDGKNVSTGKGYNPRPLYRRFED